MFLAFLQAKQIPQLPATWDYCMFSIYAKMRSRQIRIELLLFTLLGPFSGLCLFSKLRFLKEINGVSGRG
jgi:hypothetical protein